MAKKKDALAVNKVTQDDIPSLLEQVNAKILELKPAKQADAEAMENRVLPGHGKIRDLNTVEKVIKAYSTVTGKEEAYKGACDELNVKVQKYAFKLDGVTGAKWKAALKAHLALMVNKTELEKLQKIKTTLEANLSAKDKLAKDLQDIAGILTED